MFQACFAMCLLFHKSDAYGTEVVRNITNVWGKGLRREAMTSQQS